jgi:hypothetical protein
MTDLWQKKHWCLWLLVLIVVGKYQLDISLLIGVNSEQRCNLLKQCLSHICETGLRILTLTFDGLSSNLTMATLMGCQLNVSKDLKTFFPHPVTYNNVYIYIYIYIYISRSLSHDQISPQYSRGKRYHI